MAEKSFRKRFFKKLKSTLGLHSYNPYFKRHFDTANSRSAIVASIIVILLEVFMHGYVFFNLLTHGRRFSSQWLCLHLPVYILLLLSAVFLLVFSIGYLRGKKLNRALGHTITLVFSIFCLGFGIYISAIDWGKGSQILAFVTMQVFVMGFFVWRPWVSFMLTGSSFAIFLIIADSLRATSFGFRLNLTTFFIALLTASICRYHQKFLEAKHEEKLSDVADYLESAATTDDVTGIPNMLSFRTKVEEIRTKDNADYHSRIFLILDIQHFSNYNEKYGFEEGTNFLRKVANMVAYAFNDDPVARVSDDHFAVFTHRTDMEKKLSSLRAKISDVDSEIKLGLKAGAYVPSATEECPANIACDYARYACNSIKNHFDKDYIEYTKESADKLKRKQYIINTIDEAVKNEYIKVYYQPVVLSENKSLCGFEALARWIDPVYGFLSPFDFISTLEENRLIHKLDAFIIKKVCDDILAAPSENIPVLPVSVNFSRLDFELMDIEKLLEECVEKQNIDKKSIHIEVTESALSLSDKNLQEMLRRLKEKNYSLWLDDFGSGYSGLNILKEYEFDMMKIDMGFLRNFSSTPKTKPILKNIVTLANDIGMHTLSEGVETEDAYEYLKSIGCERIQGYLFGKPMPKEEIFEKIRSGEYFIDKKRFA